MKPALLGLLFSAIVFNTSCAGRSKPETLAGLKHSKKTKEQPIKFETMNHEEVRKEYEDLLDLFEDKTLKEQIERRIADVYMMEGVQDQVSSQPQKSYYVEAIKSYRDVLEKYPNSPDNAEVFYQLAKAYDMEGDQEEALSMLVQLTSRHPSYANIPEAYFRMGDIYFNQQKYAKAEQSYRAVTQAETQKLNLNARYMLGWTQYKQLKFDGALTTFAAVLSDVLGANSSMDNLTKTEKPFVEDSLHSISLTLARSGGAEAIASAPQLAKKNYIWMVYENLGEYYLEKERFEDSAFTYRLFVTNYKNSDQAPRLHKRLIDSYIEGGFPLQAIEEKEVYVEYYGIYSKYAGNKVGLRSDLVEPIKQYIEELAKSYHGNAQVLEESLSELGEGKVRPDKKKQKQTQALMVTAYDKAASFYKQYIETFPKDPRTGEMTFLKAEAHYAASRFDKAITDYETVAYVLKDAGHKEHGANAGYAAVISYQQVIEAAKAGKGSAKEIQGAVKAWQAKAVESMLQFAQVYHADDRSPSVLTNAAEFLFSLDQYERALQVSSDLINNNTSLDASLKKTAYGIVAHCHFKLENYLAAEDNYFKQRQLVSKDNEEYALISERLASSIYKNTEILLAAGDKESAIVELLKIKRLTPMSSIRVSAQFDAATMMLEFENWQGAIDEFIELRQKFPVHKLAVEFPRKIAFAYEKLESWGLAGETYLELSKTDPDAELKREALFVAANMFENDKQYEQAITLFKRYARTYEKPFDTRMEARYHLALVYGKLDDINRQLYWLRRVVAGDAGGGSQRTERSRWLAAWANIQYGDYFASEFSKRRLRLPLDKSIAVKNKALKDAISRYQMAADYDLLEFASMSSFKIAGLYKKFSNELRGAPVPSGLPGDQLQMYRQILEEQASPFMDLAVELYESNLELSWEGHFNTWINDSYAQMRELKPARFSKYEYDVRYGDEIR